MKLSSAAIDDPGRQREAEADQRAASRRRAKRQEEAERPGSRRAPSAAAPRAPAALARFQRASGPTPIRNSAGAISGTNTVSKYGGPTEILPAPSASSASGYSVPRNTVPAAAASSTLFASSRLSRDTGSKSPPRPMREVRQAYSASAPPMNNGEQPEDEDAALRVDRERVHRGEHARAHEEGAEQAQARRRRSRAAPSSCGSAPRFSVTASEWMSAVPTSQGMKEAFSTGSQNHQPPQPSS